MVASIRNLFWIIISLSTLNVIGLTISSCSEKKEINISGEGIHLKKKQFFLPPSSQPIKAFADFYLNKPKSSIKTENLKPVKYRYPGIGDQYALLPMKQEWGILETSLDELKITCINDSIYQVYLYAGGVYQSKLSDPPTPKIDKHEADAIIKLFTAKYGVPEIGSTAYSKHPVFIWDLDNHLITINVRVLPHRFFVPAPSHKKEFDEFYGKSNAKRSYKTMIDSSIINIGDLVPIGSGFPGHEGSIDSRSIQITYTSKYFDVKVREINERALENESVEDSLRLINSKNRI